MMAVPANATTASSEGTEFYVTFDHHYVAEGGALERLLYLSTRSSGTATISWPNGTSDTVSLVADTITTVNATTKGIASDGSVGIGNRSAVISSSVPISVYGASVQQFTSDAFLALPTTSLGLSYRVVSFTDAWYQQISVIATEPGATVVTVTPSVNFWAAPQRNAGIPYTITLQQGEVYSVNTWDTNISGTQVTADKKIVVTSSMACGSLTGGTCDHLVSYMPPVTSWGSSFMLPGSLNTTRPDIYTILANEDGTVVRVNGNEVATLNAGQVHSYVGQPSSGVQLVDVVETSKPVLIGHGYRIGNYQGQTGDPAFSLVTPTVQFLRQYTVATPASGFAVNSLTLITLTSSVSSLRLNGAPIDGGSFTAISGSNYSVARLTVSAGSYSISGPSGIGVYVSGFNSHNSYAYPGGFALVNLVQNPGGVEELLSAAETPAPASTTTPKLATTGANVEWLLVAGLIAVIAGAGFLTVSRRKRTA